MTSPLHVLILEDRQTDVDLTLHELSRAGFELDWTHVVGEEDYRSELHEGFDVILADHTLPQFDALHALKLLQERKLDIPFIIVSGTINEEMAVECMKQGAADYLLKDRLARLGEAVRQALEQKKLREEKRLVEAAEREQRTLAEALRESVAALNSSLDLDDVLDQVIDSLQRVVPYDAANIHLVDADGDITRVVRVRGYAEGNLQAPIVGRPYQVAHIASFAQMMDTGQPVVIPDTQTDPKWGSFQEIRWIRSYAGTPILSQGKVIGFLNLDSATQGSFDSVHTKHLKAFADQASIAIENAHLYDEIRSHAEDLEQRVAERTAQLQLANQHLQTLSRLKDEFVSNVSHELRTPLSNIKLYLYLLSNKLEDGEAYLATLQRETGRLEHIIEDLLSLSHLDQRQETTSASSVDLNALMTQYVTDRLLLAQSHGLTLHLNKLPDLPPVWAEEGLLEQALSILMTNALNYTPGGGQIEVSTHSRKLEGKQWVGLSVRDNGLGIAPDEHEQLFQRFNRGKVGRESGVPGTGLGLAIVKEIVERHAGQVELDSAGIPGQGTTITVWLPAYRGSS